MNFQSKAFESAAVIAERVAALARITATKVRDRARLAGSSIELKDAFAQLQTAGGELRRIARHHGTRFVKQNASLAKAAGKDLTDLGRTVYSTFAQNDKTAPRTSGKTVSRRRAARKAA